MGKIEVDDPNTTLGMCEENRVKREKEPYFLKKLKILMCELYWEIFQDFFRFVFCEYFEQKKFLKIN